MLRARARCLFVRCMLRAFGWCACACMRWVGLFCFLCLPLLVPSFLRLACTETRSLPPSLSLVFLFFVFLLSLSRLSSPCLSCCSVLLCLCAVSSDVRNVSSFHGSSLVLSVRPVPTPFSLVFLVFSGLLVFFLVCWGSSAVFVVLLLSSRFPPLFLFLSLSLSCSPWPLLHQCIVLNRNTH